ncbi:DUF4365 domain-containing protein [Sphingomonas lycopersici]|uniref:DUF4365 domain-containing protein n=1 Tax=Sphingomonas lycopersici TaxID=2951807 RepID=A0AA41ZHF6_9SPHN|nr:DUF4365 domain-containing protein [Sphingomonas lycopersici]MCW6530815.1 DUF4365 domain-containing protein [Sphingomonas lycopersici]MCW6536711.1 DUF4365 domain-containing protein [Sphingomonas lycopersici]
MSLKSQRLGQIGVNVVERIILRDWQARWQALDSHNDDGVDGLIFLESNGEATGQVIYAQVKTYSDMEPNRAGAFTLPIGTERLTKAIARWRRLIGAAIVIYVDPISLHAFWADAKYVPPGQSQISIPSNQKFDRTARAVISHLCGTLYRDLLVPRLVAEPGHFTHLTSDEYIKVAAHKLYHSLESNPVMLGSLGPRVHFPREGWRHIIRRERPKLTRYQSFVLLGVVRPILELTHEWDLRDARISSYRGNRLVAARCAVSFPFRQTGIVNVVLRKRHAKGDLDYQFHTVYEPRRRRDVLGVREPLSQ